MMKIKICLVTKNFHKLMAAKHVFDKYGIEIVESRKDYHEIQAETSLEIARFTATQAAKDMNLPAIREDHSLFIHALNIPGPYTNYIESRIPASKLLELLNFLGDNTGHFKVATILAHPNGETFEYVFQVPVTFGKVIKGKDSKSWDGLIRLFDEKRAITEYPEEERLYIWSQGYEKVAEYILSKRKK